MTDQLNFAIAQLRHAYRQLVDLPLLNQCALADGLIAPQIERLEKLQADLAALQAIVQQWREAANKGFQEVFSNISIDDDADTLRRCAYELEVALARKEESQPSID